MTHLIFWILGLGTFWTGLKLFDDEVLLIVSVIVGSGLMFVGLMSTPVVLQITIEALLLVVLFHVCMECVKRGDRA